MSAKPISCCATWAVPQAELSNKPDSKKQALFYLSLVKTILIVLNQAKNSGHLQ
jgi:hypothetical protein